MSLDQARAVADAVLYEGYLLYPYRASAQKNQVRWTFGVLGPPGAAAAGLGEEPDMSFECLLRLPIGDSSASGAVELRLRFLQLQHRSVEKPDPDRPGRYLAVDALTFDDRTLFSWDEAVEQEVSWPAFHTAALIAGVHPTVAIGSGEEAELLADGEVAEIGRVVRRRWPLSAELIAAITEVDGFFKLSVSVRNTHPAPVRTPEEAVRHSLLGAHLLLEASGVEFVSLLDPPPEAAEAAESCRQHRCWPVLAGPPTSRTTLLASPIILYDHPEVAAESAGALFDSTEIDEILTLRVMTMTEAEKAEARATDPRAAEIIDRCERMGPEDLLSLHGIRREPYADDSGSVPWWDPAADESVRPELDTVVIDQVSVHKGSLVRIRPTRRADAQDLFYAGREARVSAVMSDVDGGVHVAVVVLDDPAAELHDWYGRYLYFAPDELEPLPDEVDTGERKEGTS